MLTFALQKRNQNWCLPFLYESEPTITLQLLLTKWLCLVCKSLKLLTNYWFSAFQKLIKFITKLIVSQKKCQHEYNWSFSEMQFIKYSPSNIAKILQKTPFSKSKMQIHNWLFEKGLRWPLCVRNSVYLCMFETPLTCATFSKFCDINLAEFHGRP